MGSKLILLLWLIVGSLLTFFCLNEDKRELLLKYKNIYLNQTEVSATADVNDTVKQDGIKPENPTKEDRAVFTVIEQETPTVVEEVMEKNSTSKNLPVSTATEGTETTGLAPIEDKITVLLEEHPIYFKTSSSTIRKDSQEGLNQVSTALKALPKGTVVTVEGHTDATGDATLNKQLSQQRADAVKFYLKKSGLNQLIIKATGYGEERPLVNDPNDKKNRRVEIRLERGE